MHPAPGSVIISITPLTLST